MLEGGLEMYRWSSLLGHFEQEDEKIIFKGEPTTYQGMPAPSIGNYICDQRFSGGTINGTISFEAVNDMSGCEFILNYLPSTGNFVTAGFSGVGMPSMFSVRSFVGGRWNNHAVAGERANLESGRDYELKVRVVGSRVTVTVDGVDVIVTVLPYVLPQGQV